MENKRTILIIDDDDALRIGLAATFQRKGFAVVLAGNGQAGLEKARAAVPDLIICDVMMPPPDGFEVRRLLSQTPPLASIPFIFLTARSGIEDRLSGIDNGADDYIVKPFDPKELVARVESVFRRVNLEQARGRDQMKALADQELEKFRQEVLQNFHHELRTPLTNIMLPLEAALKQKFSDPEEQVRFLRTALLNADRLESLMTDFILLTNLDQGNLNMVRQPIDVETQILAPARRRLQRYEEKHIQLITHLSVQGQINAPRKEFTHIILHLLDNAFKFSPQGGSVELSISSDPGGNTSVGVSDQGPGIPVGLREKVFERYYQRSQGNSREYEGLGVGLPLARAVIEKWGGRLLILDAPVGCRIGMYLPAQAPGEPAYG
ncbi:MAG TPA: response regulator [Anaerolineales bacterium]|nr:response regulator [Anaerolineales bacterium]